MDVPGIVEEALDGEEVAATVDLGGDDALFVTPTRTLIYRSEGLLSDESVEAYSHNAESLSLSEGRRKTRITLEHPIEGTEEFTLPSSAADAAIPSILAGVLRSNDVIGEGESVVDSYLFSELTLVITDDRLVKHVGGMLWDLEFEEYPFADVTAVYAEKGSVATQLIIEVDGRAERIKTPSDRSREVRETLEDALRRFHGLRPEEDLNDALAPAEPERTDAEEESDAEASTESSGGMDFGEGVEPLSAGDTTQDGRNPDPRDLEDGSSSAPSEPAPAASESDGADRAPAEPDERAPEPDDATPEGAATEPTTDAASNETTQTDVTATADAGAAGEPESPGSDASDSPTDAGTGSSSATSPSASQPTSSGAQQPDAEFQDAGFEPATDPTEELAEEVAELRAAVQKQNKLLTRQHKTIEKLVEELRRGR
ncbi:hypothetical protein L593_12760 [Salinarchaeum sp. Harcht-Bsk1]|uniref:DUF7115 domain-containing protein n=1 Tax=Salinarchaeum sp. Harcht-Bsk1 TaxID=1333523 RepID=UPI0003423791|nr:hypothetical protein [Salinarchaeum sp. Harcht-Bsk1]AGN02491.1 hypothetical protein L593_12760 [Salinarchaeum sp. Harcht-Bsk1]